MFCPLFISKLSAFALRANRTEFTFHPMVRKQAAKKGLKAKSSIHQLSAPLRVHREKEAESGQRPNALEQVFLGWIEQNPPNVRVAGTMSASTSQMDIYLSPDEKPHREQVLKATLNLAEALGLAFDIEVRLYKPSEDVNIPSIHVEALAQVETQPA
jgi:hypothetical protein